MKTISKLLGWGKKHLQNLCSFIQNSEPNLYQQLNKNLLQDATKNATHNNYTSSQEL